MSRLVPAVAIALLVALTLTLGPPATRAAEGDSPAVARRRPVVVGNLAVHVKDVVAVYRPADQQIGVVVFVGRPGQSIQPVVFRDMREANAVFDGLWNNNDVAKDPGDDDASRPLTRMMLKDAAAGAERKTATLIANVDRLLAVSADPSNRAVRVYLDKPTSEVLPSGGRQDYEYIEIRNVRDEADTVLAAYKACLYTK